MNQIKRIIFIVILVLISGHLAAQDSLFVSESGKILYKQSIENIDSIRLSGTANYSLDVYKSGFVVYKRLVNDIDSITFTRPTESPLSYVFDIAALPVLTIDISTEEWNKLLTYYDINSDNEEYVRCDFAFDKNNNIATAASTGIRIRGNTSRRRPEGVRNEPHNANNPDWHHASFALKFNKFTKGQKMEGVEKINLKWFKDDAMYVREVYCYDLFERFGVWTAPQSSYCRLNIKIKEDAKTAYFGVYQMVEPVDEDYLKNRKSKLRNANGFLWKAAWGADFVNADKNRMGIENITLTSNYTPVYDLKTNTAKLDSAKTQLVDFMTKLNNKTGNDFKTWVDATMDVKLFLKTYAVSVMCGMWDDYWANKNNFYFYFDTAGKFYFIPYDYDNTLGTSLLMNNSGTQDLLNWGNNSNPLVKKIISIPEYESLYKSYINELANSNNDYFNASKSAARIINWQQMIRDYIPNDTGEDMQITDKPASWGNCGFYRLLGNSNNFFEVRAANIPK